MAIHPILACQPNMSTHAPDAECLLDDCPDRNGLCMATSGQVDDANKHGLLILVTQLHEKLCFLTSWRGIRVPFPQLCFTVAWSVFR